MINEGVSQAIFVSREGSTRILLFYRISFEMKKRQNFKMNSYQEVDIFVRLRAFPIPLHILL